MDMVYDMLTLPVTSNVETHLGRVPDQPLSRPIHPVAQPGATVFGRSAREATDKGQRPVSPLSHLLATAFARKGEGRAGHANPGPDTGMLDSARDWKLLVDRGRFALLMTDLRLAVIWQMKFSYFI